MYAPDLRSFPDAEAAARAAALLVSEAAARAVAERGRFTLALSGGSTPGRFFELLAQEPMDWDRTHVFWADERLVPADSPESNQRLARERLIGRVSLPPGNVHPMPSPDIPLEDAEAQAQAHEAALRAFFGKEGSGHPAGGLVAGFPRFDAVHLGVGGDGHTASLFPGQASLGERLRWVLPVRYAVASPPVARLTLTLPVLDAAREVFFLVSGADKLALARAIAAGERPDCPASRVRPASGSLCWLAG
ncbi:6-phosphogluconolactonase [Fundidesulfovibrio magnetotacticus]|uniref:6-phosphogluconolactonase n=1 Tax=Fundidesulfovibrio magnetotacticus TaxID=2730080 RepID=A0A6V8LQM5_9BACT|nr:6-phosphogluconolactonase [Fundidesulfovibrio magnetotacticus]GFK94034.1 6-phosphogluconolactonase [Fundidesulfovibrio magnetotacticus]